MEHYNYFKKTVFFFKFKFELKLFTILLKKYYKQMLEILH